MNLPVHSVRLINVIVGIKQPIQCSYRGGVPNLQDRSGIVRRDLSEEKVLVLS